MFFISSISTAIPRIFTQSIRTLITCNRYEGPKTLLMANSAYQNNNGSTVKPENMWSLDLVRTNVRNHFPYPREKKRVKTHGFKKRMSTPGGRAILMRRILKGRHVLSH